MKNAGEIIAARKKGILIGALIGSLILVGIIICLFAALFSSLRFDAREWQGTRADEIVYLPGKRLRMLKDLQSNVLRPGMSFQQVIDILGSGPVNVIDDDTKTVEYLVGIQAGLPLATYHFLIVIFEKEKLDAVEYTLD